ncbi:MAG: ABC transporter ATP-binding protein [Lachnospiraceae bacterium]|nr:ABC transporter ATP-binding protein [Lachnospiraceae bacterium]
MIEVKNLVKRYGKHAAVNDLSFKIETGKVVGFLGPNGAGKSTTMNMITGYIAPTEGQILIDGVDIEEDPDAAKKNIGYLPEIPPLYPDMRVREYLMFVAELKKVPRKERVKMVSEIMEKTKTTDVSERLIRHLSKGYKQRVGLGEAMMGYPDMIILDEPTVGLDPGQIIEIRDLIKELAKEHTVLLSSHIMQEISAVCEEIIIINEGKMIAIDTPENIINMINDTTGVHLLIKGEKEDVKNALRTIKEVTNVKYDKDSPVGFVGMTLFSQGGTDIREKIFFNLSEAGLPLYEMKKDEPTLEQAFLRLTGGKSRQFGGRKTKKVKAKTEEVKSETEETENEVSEVESKEAEVKEAKAEASEKKED